MRFLVRVEYGRQFPAFGDEADRQRVDAVTGIFVGQAFPFEDVAEVAAAMGTDDLGATPVCVRVPPNSSRIFFIEAGPAAAGVEFSLSRIKWVVAPPANKRAGRKEPVVLTAERPFRTLVDDYSFFIG